MNKKELVKEYIKKHRYFNLAEVIKKTGLSNQLAKNCLYALKSEGIIFSAGRGVYSSVTKEFRFAEKSRVVEIRQLLKKQFPELDWKGPALLKPATGMTRTVSAGPGSLW